MFIIITETWIQNWEDAKRTQTAGYKHFYSYVCDTGREGVSWPWTFWYIMISKNIIWIETTTSRYNLKVIAWTLMLYIET